MAALVDVTPTLTLVNEADFALTTTRTHDPNRADLSFPYQTTDIDEGGFTNEYRSATTTGLIKFQNALRPVPSRLIKGALDDPEKAKRLRDMHLVTWLENDPEDPRNWSKTWKWCA